MGKGGRGWPTTEETKSPLFCLGALKYSYPGFRAGWGLGGQGILSEVTALCRLDPPTPSGGTRQFVNNRRTLHPEYRSGILTEETGSVQEYFGALSQNSVAPSPHQSSRTTFPHFGP